ncbi:CU044_2847 family protein [Streptomyces sp. NPDC000345]|uniref:CU044_2847 family protein n=1 Tax=Streptomyces sp. NPDC000345 TaxID=3364537 RepID=UPI00368DD77C
MGQAIARIPLEGGGSVLVEAEESADGPVMAGRIGEAIRELPQNLHTALGPVTDMARTVLEQLRQARPDGVEVEFGVNLAAEAGAVIARTQTGCHLKVTMTWASDANADGA